jgi:RNA polymerase sigma-70 factor (ECF subfamily)
VVGSKRRRVGTESGDGGHRSNWVAANDQPAVEYPPLAAEFEALYAEHFAFVWRALRTFGVPAQNLDDGAQDVFVVVHRRFGAWGDASSIRAWLWGVARRVASARRRTVERHRRKLDALPPPDNVRPIEGRADARHRLERIAEAIDALAPPRREVWVLAELEGLRPPEIARLLGCKLNTVYSRLRRAREELSAALVRAGLDDVHSPHAMPAARAPDHERSHARAR